MSLSSPFQELLQFHKTLRLEHGQTHFQITHQHLNFLYVLIHFRISLLQVYIFKNTDQLTEF